ncbi:MAG: hypothetical protein RL387_1853 [Bacteroidota bacterium]|jgi:hypothetical protein
MPAGESLNSLKGKKNLIKELQSEIEKLYALESSITEQEFKQLEQLEKRQKSLESNLKKQEKLQKSINSSLMDFEDIDSSLVSIGNRIGKNSALYQVNVDRTNMMKATMEGISSILVENNDLSAQQTKVAKNAANAYKNTQQSILNAGLALAKNEITQVEYNNLIQKSYQGFQDLVDAIDTSTESGKQLVEIFKAAGDELQSVTKAAQSAADKLDGMHAALDQLGSTGIPLVNELSGALKDIAEKGTLGKAALIALGAAAGKLAYDYFGAPIQAAIVAQGEIKKNQIEGAANVAKAGNELAFAAKQAAMDFGYQLQEMAAQFNAASKTAFFGKGLGSVGYAASKLQLAGISAETIASATTSASKAGSGSTKLAADMAIFAERSGISVDNLANVQQAFKLLDKVSSKTALNLAEGTRAMAEQAGLNIGDVMNEVASASEMALDYQVQSGKALARQVVYAKSLGVSFSEVAKAGQSMVLNYKDSIKAEMSLSSMLGKNVNLSEVRAKFMSGDQEGALNSLKAQGLKPSEMNMFQKQALQQALGGMDLNSLEKIGTPGYQEGAGKVGTLEEKSAKASNDAFLTLKQSAASALNTQQAMIAGQKAVAQAALDTMKENAWLNSQAYLDYQTQLAQLEIERKFKENAGGALAASGGALLGNYLPDLFKMLKGGGGAAGEGGMMSGAGKFITKGGGAAIAGLVSGVMGFMDKKEKGGTTGEAVGSGVLRGGMAITGAALGTAFGPIGTLIGGFLGDAVGGWIDEYAPGVSAKFGEVWDKMIGKFAKIGDAFKPVIETVDKFIKGLGFEDGLGSIFSTVADFVGTGLVAPFEVLMSVFGWVADMATAFGQLLSGDVDGALKTLSTGFTDLMYAVFAPFDHVFTTLHNGFAKLWNSIADSALGKTFNLGRMNDKMKENTNPNDKIPQKSITPEVQKSVAITANKPVVTATQTSTKVNEKIHKKQNETLKENKFSGNVQNQMVALLATSTALMEQLVLNTAGDRQINLDGATVNKKLLANSRKNYGLTRQS